MRKGGWGKEDDGASRDDLRGNHQGEPFKLEIVLRQLVQGWDHSGRGAAFTGCTGIIVGLEGSHEST